MDQIILKPGTGSIYPSPPPLEDIKTIKDQQEILQVYDIVIFFKFEVFKIK